MNDEDFYNNIQNYLKEWEEFKDLALTHKKLNQLQSNWNSLKKWLIKKNDFYKNGITDYSENVINMVLDKMNELEGVDNESN